MKNCTPLRATIIFDSHPKLFSQFRLFSCFKLLFTASSRVDNSSRRSKPFTLRPTFLGLTVLGPSVFGLLSVLGPAPAYAQIKHITTPSIWNTARDSTGRIWGNALDQNRALYGWQGGQWQKVDFSTDGKFTPILLTQRPNGTVICLWRSEQPSAQHVAQPDTHPDTQAGSGGVTKTNTKPVNENLKDYKVSEHRGQSSRFIAAFSAELEWNPVLIASKDELWLTKGVREIYRINRLSGGDASQNGRPLQTNLQTKLQPNKSFKPVYTLGANQLFRSGKAQYWDKATNPLRAVIDGQGRIWFFSDVWSNGGNSYMLRGVLVWDGRRFTHHRTLAGLHLDGLPAKPCGINTLAVKDANHLWLALSDRGLYELDTRILKARHIVEPAPKAFQYIQQITAVGRDWYVVSGSRWGDDAAYDESVRTGNLWLLRGGRWRLLHSGLDKAGDELWNGPQMTPRPFLDTTQGLWVGAFGGSAWFLPHPQPDSRPKLQPDSQLNFRSASPSVAVDWRRGLQFHSVDRFFAVGNGRVLAHSLQGSALITDTRALLARKGSSQVTTFRTYCGLVQDRSGHLWGALSLKGKALCEWDGQRWIRHPIPPDYDLANAGEHSVDRSGRIWILPDARNGQTAIYDPNRKSWQVFASYRIALQAQLRRIGKRIVALAPPSFDRVETRGGRNPTQTPDFSADGRICYRNVSGKLCYFDGKLWHQWTRQQVTKDLTITASYADRAPFFDRRGRLCINFDDKTWKWSGAGGWKSYEEEADPRPAAHDNDPTEVAAPAGTVFSDTGDNSHPASPDSIIRDGKGFVWIVWRSQLYKTLPGLQATQFAAKENHPFIDGRFFNQVFVDNKGNTFFNTAYGFVEYVMISASPPPNTKIKITPRAVDAFTFNFSSNDSSPVSSDPSVGARPRQWFKWRVDNEPWSQPQTTSQVRLDALPGGKHTLEAAVINNRLSTDPTPARVVFLVKIDPAKQVAAFITKLSSPDYSRREAAVTGLAKQPKRALPALKAVRARASENTRWWIDAAIQQIERDAHHKMAK
jgi:hypothetical protein